MAAIHRNGDVTLIDGTEPDLVAAFSLTHQFATMFAEDGNEIAIEIGH